MRVLPRPGGMDLESPLRGSTRHPLCGCVFRLQASRLQEIHAYYLSIMCVIDRYDEPECASENSDIVSGDVSMEKRIAGR